MIFRFVFVGLNFLCFFIFVGCWDFGDFVNGLDVKCSVKLVVFVLD